ncbi:beta strand repeat-containing protein [Maribacter dokdonensis]|uniref:beta strand repeat-containing protein n=1 Tax=Maribacter dokdonensis TaxID=320912 RepID=UPI003296A5B6
MSSKIKFLLFFSFISFCATAQVKIGQNPNTIHSASIVELESTDKAFVLTRLSTAQMQAITPLNGAVVYNTDTQCVHYYNGTVWTNLCDGINTNDFSFTDNGDGTITLDDGNGNTITFNGAAQTISTLIDNGDGTYTYTNENGIETVISIAVTDNQNLQTDNTPGNISIDNGNTLTINVDDADADAQNEIQTLDYTSGVLTLSNDPNATVVDLSAFDQNAADDFSGSFNDLNDLPANLDIDATDDFNTAIIFDGTNLTVSDAGGDVSTDISGLAYDDTALRADVDQNTADIDALETEQTTQNTNIATNATDIDSLEAEQTTQNNSIATNATNIDALEAEQTTQNNAIATNATDIDALEAEQTTQNNSIATNVTDISTNTAAIAAHNTADGDLSDSNEYNTGISFDGTDLTVTDLGGDQTVDISGLAYDDTVLRADVDQNTADIDALEAEQTTQNNSIATNATDNSTNAAAIAAHNSADGDLSDSNEFNTGISFDGTDLTVTDLGGDQTVDISGLAYDDTALRADVDQNTADIDALETEQTTQNTNIATNATDIDNLEAEQSTQNNSITTNATNISTNAAAIAAHNTADGDLSDSNEYNTGISFDGTDLTVTDLGGDQTVNISGLAYDDTALRADVDQNTADIDALENEQTTQNTNIATNATDIDTLEAEQTTQNNSIATNATDISTNTAAIAAHNSADGDLSDSNEYNTGISFDGTDLTVTDLGGDQTVDISGLAYDDTTLKADVDQNTADIDALEAEQTTQNTNIATNATDIDNLEAEQTTQNNSIATNATDIDNLEAEQTTQNNSIATNATDIDALEAEQTTQNTNIATNATDIDNLEAEQTTQNNSIATNATDISTNSAAIAAHNTADGDLSDSNEYNTGISFDGTDLTVTDGGGDQTVDISGLAYDDTALRADVDQNTADIDVLKAEQTTQNNSIATNATDIDNLEAEQTTQNNSIATNATDIDNLEAEQTTQNNSISSNSAAIAAHNTSDEDLSATNETNTSFSTVDVAGTDYLRISDSNGDLDVPLSDLSHTGTTGSVFFAGADGTPTENNGQLFWNSSSNSLGVGTSSPTNKLHVSGAIRSQGILNSNGTENEPAYRFNDDTNTGMFRPAADEIAFTVGGIEAMKIEETSSDTSVIINETLELEGAVLDENDSPGTAGQVLTSTATGTEWVNSMSPIKAIGKISAAGGVTKATAGVTVTRISVGYYRVTLPTGAVSDADYIIQLTQPGRGGAGNDDPGISYSNQTATSFEVIIGDNDNGGTDRSRFDSEFMFTVLDL